MLHKVENLQQVQQIQEIQKFHGILPRNLRRFQKCTAGQDCTHAAQCTERDLAGPAEISKDSENFKAANRDIESAAKVTSSLGSSLSSNLLEPLDMLRVPSESTIIVSSLESTIIPSSTDGISSSIGRLRTLLSDESLPPHHYADHHLNHQVREQRLSLGSKIVLWYAIHHWHHHALHATHQDTSELQIHSCLSNVWSWNGIHRNASNHQGSFQVWRPSSEQPQGDAGCKYITMCVCLRMCLKSLLLLRNLLGCLHQDQIKAASCTASGCIILRLSLGLIQRAYANMAIGYFASHTGLSHG